MKSTPDFGLLESLIRFMDSEIEIPSTSKRVEFVNLVDPSGRLKQKWIQTVLIPRPKGYWDYRMDIQLCSAAAA
jgi:hypothetical protein